MEVYLWRERLPKGTWPSLNNFVKCHSCHKSELPYGVTLLLRGPSSRKWKYFCKQCSDEVIEAHIDWVQKRCDREIAKYRALQKTIKDSLRIKDK